MQASARNRKMCILFYTPFMSPSRRVLRVRRVFFISLLLVALTCVIAWCVLHFSVRPEEEAPHLDERREITVLQDGKLRTLPLSEWLPGVVAAEMPASFEPAALRAQAVAARTYILERAGHRPKAHPDADVCDNYACCTAWLSDADMSEKWGDQAQENIARICAAVTDTDGEILSYAGQPIRAVFHSSSAGRTESSAALWGDMPYLVSVSTPETAEDVPNYVSVTELSRDAVREAVRKAYPDCELPEDAARWFGEPELDDSGRVAEQSVGSLTLTGAQVRALLGLRSAAYTVAYSDGFFRFTTTGYGHGVGMSQYGANVMAKQGSSYAEILTHYYPGAVLCKLGEEA